MTTTVRLDRPAEANPFELDADFALAGLVTPALLDEWQLVPDVVGAVKRSVDDSPGVGKFVITGSAQAERRLPTWPLTGRATRLLMYGLTEREIEGDLEGPGFLDRIHSEGLSALTPVAGLSVRDYVGRAVAGTGPYPRLQLDTAGRRDWYRGYVDQVVLRDLADLEPGRDPVRLRRFLQAYALNTGGVVPLSTLHDAAGIDQKTANVYLGLIQDLFLAQDVPAYVSHRLKRLSRMPKRTLIEPALLAAMTGLDADGLLRDENLRGRILETFVIAQLRPEAALSDVGATLMHMRDAQNRREVDVIVEYGDGRVLGIEVKASATPRPADAKHLMHLRDELGSDWIGGIVLHCGNGVVPLGEKTVAAPISTLWSRSR